MDIKNYRKRVADDKIEHYLKLFGAVSIEGPKYCGKTWAGRYHSKSEVLLHNTTRESSNNVELAKISPSLILKGEKPKLIDEWQEATNLWDEISADVDRTGLKGQYILTGSSTPNRTGIASYLNVVLCVICGLSNATYRRPDGVYVVPITSLKP